MDEIGCAKLKMPNWFLEECDKTEKALNHMRRVLGTFNTDRNVTYAYLEGYLSGIKSMYRRVEEGE